MIRGRWKAHRKSLALPQLQDTIEVLSPLPAPSPRTHFPDLPLRAARFGLKQRRQSELESESERPSLRFAADALEDHSLSFDDMIAMFRRIELAD